MKESIKAGGYKYLGYDRASHEHSLLNLGSNTIEIWFANKNHASYGLIYKNTHLEFARTLK